MHSTRITDDQLAALAPGHPVTIEIQPGGAQRATYALATVVRLTATQVVTQRRQRTASIEERFRLTDGRGVGDRSISLLDPTHHETLAALEAQRAAQTRQRIRRLVDAWLADPDDLDKATAAHDALGAYITVAR